VTESILATVRTALSQIVEWPGDLVDHEDTIGVQNPREIAESVLARLTEVIKDQDVLWLEEQYEKCRDRLLAAGAKESFDDYSVSVLSECIDQIITERDDARAAIQVPVPEEGRWAYETSCLVQGVAPCWHAISVAQQEKWAACAKECRVRRDHA
jgi:hypothetical protein